MAGRGRGGAAGAGGAAAVGGTKLKGEEDGGVSPMIIQSSNSMVLQVPANYPPLARLPKPPQLTSSDKEAVEIARFLCDHFRYSGYHITDPPKQSHVVEKYTDRYRRILGKRRFFDEIEHPSPYLFPGELLKGLERPAPASFFSSRVKFLSSHVLAHKVARLVRARTPAEIASENDSSPVTNRPGGEKSNGGRGGGGDDDDEGDEEEEEAEEDEDEDDMDGGDYTGRYQEDDDGDGDDDVFGEDEGEVF